MTDTSNGFEPERSRSTSHPHTLEVIANDTGPGEYTFVPRNADDGERLTRWISADADDVVELRAWR